MPPDLSPEVVERTRQLLASTVERLEKVAEGHGCIDVGQLVADVRTVFDVMRVEEGEVPAGHRACSPSSGCRPMSAEATRAWARRMANIMGSLATYWHAPEEEGYHLEPDEEGPEPWDPLAGTTSLSGVLRVE